MVQPSLLARSHKGCEKPPLPFPVPRQGWLGSFFSLNRLNPESLNQETEAVSAESAAGQSACADAGCFCWILHSDCTCWGAFAPRSFWLPPPQRNLAQLVTAWESPWRDKDWRVFEPLITWTRQARKLQEHLISSQNKHLHLLPWVISHSSLTVLMDAHQAHGTQRSSAHGHVAAGTCD